jgi:hypothetical protein
VRGDREHVVLAHQATRCAWLDRTWSKDLCSEEQQFVGLPRGGDVDGSAAGSYSRPISRPFNVAACPSRCFLGLQRRTDHMTGGNDEASTFSWHHPGHGGCDGRHARTFGERSTIRCSSIPRTGLFRERSRPEGHRRPEACTGSRRCAMHEQRGSDQPDRRLDVRAVVLLHRDPDPDDLAEQAAFRRGRIGNYPSNLSDQRLHERDGVRVPVPVEGRDLGVRQLR